MPQVRKKSEAHNNGFSCTKLKTPLTASMQLERTVLVLRATDGVSPRATTEALTAQLGACVQSRAHSTLDLMKVLFLKIPVRIG